MVRQNLFKSFLQSINRPGTVVFMSSRTGGPVTLVAEWAWLNIQPNCIVSLGPGQTIATCQRNIVGHVMFACVWPPCWAVLLHVGRCWLKFEDGQIWVKNTQYVATRCNTTAKHTQHVAPNNVAICCVGRGSITYHVLVANVTRTLNG